MHLPQFKLIAVIFVAFVASSCGGGGDDSSATDEPAASEVVDDTAGAAADDEDSLVDEIVVDEPDETVDDSAAMGGCDQVLTSDEVESILGSPVEFNGSSEVCTVVFAADSIGNLQAFSGSKADQAIEGLLAQFTGDATASADGILLDDGRGYVYDTSAVVRGESGRTFRFDAPANLDVEDIQGAMQLIADLLLTR